MRGERQYLGALTVIGFGAAVAVVALAVSQSRAPSARGVVRVLQLNLCNSGIASCYTGRSVARGVSVVRAQRPDVVTLNEVCRSDLATFRRALSARGPVVSAFRPAVDRAGDRAVRCRNGEKYGIAVLARVAPARTGYATYGGIYPMQDHGDVEKRVWVCVHAPAHPYLCTTHLASASPPVALAQCSYLLRTVLPGLRARHGDDPVLLAGDLNLESGRPPDPRECVPAGYAHADDGARQHMIAGPGYQVDSVRAIDMHGTTDHPGLLVGLRTPGRTRTDTVTLLRGLPLPLGYGGRWWKSILPGRIGT